MAEPTIAQRKMLAMMKIAMPDGSFYIRDRAELHDAIQAVGRATPNGNESEVARRNEVRRHVMTRAKALKLENMIPDTWNSDGSLKQTAMTVDDFLAHYGVVGMHWRSHKSDGHLQPGSAPGQGRLANLTSDQRKFEIERLKTHLADLRKQRATGKPSTWHGHNAILRAQARLSVLQRHQSQEENRKNAAKPKGVGDKTPIAGKPTIEGKPPAVRHLPPPHLRQSDFDEFLQHFGRKGMKWGEHRFGRDRGTTTVHPVSTDAAKAIAIRAKVQQHGIHSLSNQELQHLVTRLNLERQHSNLHPTVDHVSKGHDFVKKTLAISKTGLEVYNTARQVQKVIDELTKKK